MTDFSSSVSGSAGWRSIDGVRAAEEALQRPARVLGEFGDTAPGRETDSVELSDRARLLASLRPAGANRETDQTFRPDLVERIRREIKEGTYDTPTRAAIAADRFVQTLRQQEGRDTTGVDRQA